MPTLQSDLEYISQIIQLKLEVINLSLKNHHLGLLLKGLIKYDFIETISSGTILFVGEGNLSFVCCLLNKINKKTNVIASTFEPYNCLTDYAKNNAELLKLEGVEGNA